MAQAWINWELEEYISTQFPDRKVSGYYEKYSRGWNRYIQVSTSISDDDDIHYEYYQGAVHLHLEDKYHDFKYKSFCKQLRARTLRNPSLKWEVWQNSPNHSCRILMPTESWGEVRDAFKAIMAIFDDILTEILNEENASLKREVVFSDRAHFNENSLMLEDVCLDICSLGTIFSNNLVIPDYQRNYCWGEKEVDSLWNTLTEMVDTKDYHLGIIILHKTSDAKYSVIDGQQRLVTLTLLCNLMGYSGSMPLLSQSFHSKYSRTQVGRNLYHLSKLVRNNKDSFLLNRIINNLRFSVLILKEGKLELAYTFFSNVNSKGVTLSDLDLLKAHHLRFLENEIQTEWIAENWNKTLQSSYERIEETLSLHLLRLRKWLRKYPLNPDESHPTLNEYSAAKEIEEIKTSHFPLNPYVKISGGEYFFRYASEYSDIYNDFTSTPEISYLVSTLTGETHFRYTSVILTLSFAYFLKFRTAFLAEAMFAIIGSISQHRYKFRANKKKIEEAAINSDIGYMISQAPAPAFFIAECFDSIRIHPLDLDELSGIRMRYYRLLQDLFAQLETRFTVSSVLDTLYHEYNW